MKKRRPTRHFPKVTRIEQMMDHLEDRLLVTVLDEEGDPDFTRMARGVQVLASLQATFSRRRDERASAKTIEGEVRYTRLASMAPLHPDDAARLDREAGALRKRELDRLKALALEELRIEQADHDNAQMRIAAGPPPGRSTVRQDHKGDPDAAPFHDAPQAQLVETATNPLTGPSLSRTTPTAKRPLLEGSALDVTDMGRRSDGREDPPP